MFFRYRCSSNRYITYIIYICFCTIYLTIQYTTCILCLCTHGKISKQAKTFVKIYHPSFIYGIMEGILCWLVIGIVEFPLIPRFWRRPRSISQKMAKTSTPKSQIPSGGPSHQYRKSQTFLGISRLTAISAKGSPSAPALKSRFRPPSFRRSERLCTFFPRSISVPSGTWCIPIPPLWLPPKAAEVVPIAEADPYWDCLLP